VTLFVVGLLCVLFGAVLGAWYGFALADAIQKTTCTCRTPHKTEATK